MRDRFRAGKRLWSAAEVARLHRLYPHLPTAEVARQLRRTVCAVYARADILGLAKSAAFLASPAAGRTNGRQGIGTRFERGHVPANKGLRRPGYGPARMKATQFKPGARPQTWVPIGTEVVDSDGYRKRKISDRRDRPARFNWKFVHVLVWEAAHGRVRKGQAIVFKNGDSADIRLANLERLTRAQLMRRNTVHNLPKPLARAVQLLGALHRQIRKRDDAHAEK